MTAQRRQVKRRVRDDETEYGPTAPVTYLHEDGSVERYAVPVECWVWEDPPAPVYVPPPVHRIRSGEVLGGVQFVFEELP